MIGFDIISRTKVDLIGGIRLQTYVYIYIYIEMPVTCQAKN